MQVYNVTLVQIVENLLIVQTLILILFQPVTQVVL